MPATLPPELLNIIIPASVETTPTRTNLAERTRTLCTLSLVNKTWHAWTAPQIHKHLQLHERHLRRMARDSDTRQGRSMERTSHKTLRSSSSASRSRTRREQDVNFVATHDLESRAHEVETVALGKWIDEYGSGLKSMLKNFDSCKEVYVEGTKSWSALTSVSTLPSVDVLHLTRVYNSLPPPDGFPHVRRLSVAFGLNDGIDWSFMSTHKLPKLSTLILDPYDWTFSQAQVFQTAFATTSPQLKALALGGTDNGQVDWVALLDKTESLKHLFIHTAGSPALTEAVPKLPAQLQSLRIASTSATPEQVAAMLGANDFDEQTNEVPLPPVSLRELERLILPQASKNGWNLTTESEQASLALIERWCAQRGVKLEFRERGKVALEDWQVKELEENLE